MGCCCCCACCSCMGICCAAAVVVTAEEEEAASVVVEGVWMLMAAAWERLMTVAPVGECSNRVPGAAAYKSKQS